MLLTDNLKKIVALLIVFVLFAVVSVEQSFAGIDQVDLLPTTQLWSGKYNKREMIQFHQLCQQENPGYDQISITIDDPMLVCYGTNYATEIVDTVEVVLATQPWNGVYDNGVFTAFYEQCQQDNPDVDYIYIVPDHATLSMTCHGEIYETVTSVSLLNEDAVSANVSWMLVCTMMMLLGLTIVSKRQHKL